MLPSGLKPNLAATLTKPELIRFPVYASPKIDGIRCMFFGGVAYSRSLKPIPNESIQAWAKQNAFNLESLDGELVVGEANAPDCMQASMGVMRKSGEPNFSFHVFDMIERLWGFEKRHAFLIDHINFSEWDRTHVELVPQHLCSNPSQLDRLEAMFLEDGYEGMMIRSPDSLYKFGRSTEREGGLVKVKRFSDAEAEVIGFEEEMHNGNEATTDALGRTERSTQASGLSGKGRLGALRVVRKFDNGQACVFNIGTGFTAAQREELWQRRDSLIGTLVTYKFFDHGIKEAPRHPVFKSFRNTEDMSQ